jgi:hypothetical protein
MTQQVVNVGSIAGDGTGDKGQTPFNKTNANFTELYGNSFYYGVDSGAANTYLVLLATLKPNPLAFPSSIGTLLRFAPANANSGASTLNGTTILNNQGAALTGGELQAGVISVVELTGSGWQLILPNTTALIQELLTQAVLGAVLYPRTPAESAASLSPNTLYFYTDPRRQGALINGTTDDTTAIQNWINLAGNQGIHAQQVVLQGVGGICMVSQITFNVAGVRFFGNGMVFRGNSTTPLTTSIVEIKAGVLIQDLAVDGLNSTTGFANPNYQCGVHWYTNNLNIYNPSFTRIVNLQTSSCIIGLCVGALPSQSLPIPAQGTVQASGIATDAPLSESSLVNFSTGNSCVIGMWVSQPNCKLALTNCTIIGNTSSWSTYPSGYSAASACAMVIKNANTQFSEISMQGGELVQNSVASGLYLQITNGHLYCEGTVVEVTCSSYFSGAVGVVFRDCLDFGFNFPGNYAPFLIDTNCQGFMNISGGAVVFPNGDYVTAAGPLVKGASSISGSFSPNYGHFVVNFDRVDLQDIPYLNTPSYGPICLGVNFTLSRCTQSSWTADTRNSLVFLDDRSESLLDGQVDVTNKGITAYGANGNATSGGWAFSVGTGSWGSEASGITVEGFALATALHMSAAASSTCQATSPTFNVTPERTYQIKGWIKSPTTTGGATGILIRTVNLTFAGGGAGTTNTYFLNVADTALGSTWQQLSAFVTIPTDTTKIQLQIVAQNGSAVQLVGLQLI